MKSGSPARRNPVSYSAISSMALFQCAHRSDRRMSTGIWTAPRRVSGRMQFESPNVLVLGAGGIIGEAWMVGLLAGLNDASGFDGRDCEHFVGTSAGSIVAAGLAAGVDPASRLEQLPEQPQATAEPDAPRSLLGGALRFGRGAGATAIAPLAALALRSTAMSGAAVRRAALGRVPAGKRSLAGLGSAIR